MRGRGKLRVRRREESKGKGEQKKKKEIWEDSSANQPSSIPLTAAVILAGRGSLAHQEKKKKYNKLYFHFSSVGEQIRRLPGGEREQEERGIRELLQPPCVLQGKMDSDSGEQSDGDLSPGQESFNSRSLALQAQKKILSKMATMVVANMLTDDTSSEILDELYKASREFTKSKKEAHKIIKDVIKIALKIGILYRNHQFSPDELDTVERFKKKMNQAAMTAVSFYEVEYTFDRNILSELLLECRDLLHTLVEQHLTARSHARINHVFNHFAHGEFLAELYGDGEEYRLSLRKICNGINKLLDEGTL
uniref:TNF alpha induced protein 8 like 3 n=4 Tax=Percomorphaceae TaxID=1489872 RepID=A0A665V3X0_ECHNA